MRNMTGFGLKEKQKVAIFLCFLIVWKGTFLNFGSFFEMVGNFFSLYTELTSREWMN
jgi:hypothetical protein